jgi:predicted PurR-regulated permease PerM
MRKADAQRWTPYVLLGLFLGLSALAWWTAKPFYPPLVVAAFLVAALQRPHEWLLGRLGGRRRTAAAISATLVTATLVLPLMLFWLALARELPGALDAIRGWLGPEGIAGLPRKVPQALQPLASLVLGPRGGPEQSALQEHVTKAVTTVAPFAGGFLLRAFDYLVMTLVLVIALYFLFLDGRSLVASLLWMLPLKPSYSRELVREFFRVAHAMIWGTAAIAVGQGLCGSVIFWALGIPAPLLLAIAMAFASFIPAVGTTLVWVPIAVVLAVTGHVAKAIVLAALCTVVIVIFVDHLLRPLVVKDQITLHPLVTFVAMFGGIVTFGLIGLLVGPLIASALATVLRIYRRDLGPHAQAEAPRSGLAPEERPGVLRESESARH